MKILISLLSLFLTLYSKDIKPSYIINTKGFVTDFVIDKSKLYIANDIGSIEVFDFLKEKIVDEIVLPKMLSVKGEMVDRRILSIDRLNGKTLMVISTLKGYREVYLYDGKNFEQLVSLKDKMTAKEARFIDEKNFLFATIGHEVISYNHDDSFVAYKRQIEASTFRDVQLSSDKKTMVTASESGRVSIVDTKTGQILKELESLNVDNIHKVDYKNGVIITAGQDRRVGVYITSEDSYYIKSKFLVYCVALSPSAKRGVYSSNEEHDLTVFDIKTQKEYFNLKGHYATPTNIKFISEYELFSAGDEKKVFYWNLK